MKRYLFSCLFAVALAGGFVAPQVVRALDPIVDEEVLSETNCGGKNPDGSLQPACSLNTFVRLGVNASKIILGVVGALTLAMFVWGGVTLLISGGNTEAVKKGKDTLVASVIGLVIVFGSYTIINFVVNNVFQAKVTINNEQVNAFNGTAPEDSSLVCGAKPTGTETCIGQTEKCTDGQVVRKKCSGKGQQCCQVLSCTQANGACISQEQCSSAGGSVLNFKGCAADQTCCRVSTPAE